MDVLVDCWVGAAVDVPVAGWARRSRMSDPGELLLVLLPPLLLPRLLPLSSITMSVSALPPACAGVVAIAGGGCG